MNANEWFEWGRLVRAHGSLSAQQKLVLLSLADFADFPSGTNARPGNKALGEACGCSDDTAGEALRRGIDLGLIEMTARHVPKARRAAVYRLLPTISSLVATGVEDGSNPTGTGFETNFYPGDDRGRTDFKPGSDEFLTRFDPISNPAGTRHTDSYTPTQENTVGSARVTKPSTSLGGHAHTDDDDMPLDPDTRSAIATVVVDEFRAHPQQALTDRQIAEKSNTAISDVHAMMDYTRGWMLSDDGPLVCDHGRDGRGDRQWRLLHPVGPS